MDILKFVSEYASVITALLMFITTIILTLKSIRTWLATILANNVNVNKLSKDSDLYIELAKNFTYEKNISEIEITLLRLELLHHLYFAPDDKKSIFQLIDKYKKSGGNSYMCDLIAKWEKNEFKSAFDKIDDVVKSNQEKKLF